MLLFSETCSVYLIHSIKKSDTHMSVWLPVCVAPAVKTLLVGSSLRSKGYRVQHHLFIFICLCYFSVLYISAVVLGVVVCIYV